MVKIEGRKVAHYGLAASYQSPLDLVFLLTRITSLEIALHCARTAGPQRIFTRTYYVETFLCLGNSNRDKVLSFTHRIRKFTRPRTRCAFITGGKAGEEPKPTAAFSVPLLADGEVTPEKGMLESISLMYVFTKSLIPCVIRLRAFSSVFCVNSRSAPSY